uniref:Uncharacterized protein n=1 Tax=Ananas comosus var. bracteatus TaxID=296719 RepID=A0A6V7P4Q8_ANACO|nr:unnamed protein product [Ananas comosus var. bracteatus]
MMKRVARRVSMESFPSSSSYPVGEDVRERFKFQSLLQDYEELVKEAEAKKMKLQKTKQKKLRLLAEIKFLRRKYKSLIENRSQRAQYRIKKQPHIIPCSPVAIPRPPHPTARGDLSLEDKSRRGRGGASTSTTAMFDLNQVSSMHEEEMGCQVDGAPLKVDNSERCTVDGDAAASNLKLSICRDVGKNPSRIGKRKISWQDQVALKV